MKILQVAYKSSISGGEKVLFDLAVSLAERGHEVVAVCPDPGQLPDELGGKGIRTAIIPFQKTYDMVGALGLSRFIASEKADVLHSHSMLTNIISRLAGRWAAVPVSVSTEHLTMELARGGRGKGAMERWKARYYRLMDNYTSRFNSAVIAVSGAVKRDLVEQGVDEARIVVIRNGIRIADHDTGAGVRVRRDLGIRDGARVVGAVGRLSPQKDYPTFLRAAREALSACPDAVFLIVGEGHLRGELESMADSLQIAGNVRFLGYRANIMDIVSSFDVFALSSLWEGLPLAVLEAMSLGKPVVATAVPGTAEAVADGETGLLVPFGDHRALARHIVELLRDPLKAERMGEAGRRRVVELFSLERMAGEHQALYEKLLRESTREAVSS